MLSGIKSFLFGRDKNINQGRNIILTGIPRSGTTLACKILGEVENQIALNEPIAGEKFKQGISGKKVIENAFSDFRTSLLKKGLAPVRAQNGKITDNAYSEEVGSRKKQLQRTEVKFDKKLNPDFTLILKHCSEFSLILPQLQDDFECFAIVRNPLAVLASWNSVDVPVSRGKVAKSQILNPGFFEKLEEIKTLEDKQFFILDWYYSCYDILPQTNVIPYESIIASNGAALSIISQKETISKSELSSKNQNHLYDKKAMASYLDILTSREGSYLKYYSKEEIIQIAENLNL